MLYKVVRTFESVDKILRCGIHLKGVETTVLSCGQGWLLPYYRKLTLVLIKVLI